MFLIFSDPSKIRSQFFKPHLAIELSSYFSFGFKSIPIKYVFSLPTGINNPKVSI